MKKRKVQQAILFLLFSCICFCSCEKEKRPEKVELSYIQLSMPQSIHVETKSEDEIPNLGGTTVDDVWIVQFEIKTDGSTSCLKALYVPQSNISQSTDPKTDLIVNLQTGGSEDNETAKFQDKNSRFYVIANGGKSLFTTNTTDNASMYLLTGNELTSLTEEILKAKTIDIGTSENPLVTTPPTLLSSEPFDYTPTEEGIIKIRTQMFRAFAKIKININSLTPGLFTLDQGGTQNGIIKIYNLPQKMATYRAGGEKNQAYPLIKDITGGAFDLYVDQIAAGKRNVSREFYMAENLRGIGTSTTQQGKNQKDNGPGTDSDKLAGCTKIELAGTYKYDPTHTDGVKVKYTFYLGGNFTNDYNIARDYSYELTFRIAGPNSADVRVDITNGNVAVFDEVVIIPDITVDF